MVGLRGAVSQVGRSSTRESGLGAPLGNVDLLPFLELEGAIPRHMVVGLRGAVSQGAHPTHDPHQASSDLAGLRSRNGNKIAEWRAQAALSLAV